MKNRWLIEILLLVFSASLLFSAESVAQSTQNTKSKVLRRSLFFPGLGQLYEKQYTKAAIFMSSEIFCIVQALIANKKGNDFYWLYRFASTKEEVEQYRPLTEKYDKRRNAYLLAGAAIWIVNMVDAYFHTKKKYPKKLAFILRPTIDHEKKQAALDFCFCF